MVSNCTVPRGVGSITASGKKLQERMLTVCQQCLLWFLNKKYCAVHVASLSLFDLIGLSFACTGKNGDLIARRWTRFQTVPFPEVLAPSLHQAKSCKKECWRFASNAFFGFLKMNYYTVKSFLVQIVRTVFRTHRQER